MHIIERFRRSVKGFLFSEPKTILLNRDAQVIRDHVQWLQTTGYAGTRNVSDYAVQPANGKWQESFKLSGPGKVNWLGVVARRPDIFGKNYTKYTVDLRICVDDHVVYDWQVDVDPDIPFEGHIPIGGAGVGGSIVFQPIHYWKQLTVEMKTTTTVCVECAYNAEHYLP